MHTPHLSHTHISGTQPPTSTRPSAKDMYVHGMDEVKKGSEAETRRFAVGLFQGKEEED